MAKEGATTKANGLPTSYLWLKLCCSKCGSIPQTNQNLPHVYSCLCCCMSCLQFVFICSMCLQLGWDTEGNHQACLHVQGSRHPWCLAEGMLWILRLKKSSMPSWRHGRVLLLCFGNWERLINCGWLACFNWYLLCFSVWGLLSQAHALQLCLQKKEHGKLTS